ncbi:hypothetical protein EVAR_83812_1 [Eumeta japonica]|uniref:Uncharacterized protein n=1 Tax=Eumeta variegata TaxID=151549 RepID=A0A4C1WFJ8_EUMVA|nr:hypothetical protein EVAR_83812_1 [Eumeta japonica]
MVLRHFRKLQEASYSIQFTEIGKPRSRYSRRRALRVPSPACAARAGGGGGFARPLSLPGQKRRSLTRLLINHRSTFSHLDIAQTSARSRKTRTASGHANGERPREREAGPSAVTAAAGPHT